MNDFFLDSVRGMKISAFGYACNILAEIQQRSQKIDTAFGRIKDQKRKFVVYWSGSICFQRYYAVYWLNLLKQNWFRCLFLVGVILLMSSYGPVIILVTFQ